MSTPRPPKVPRPQPAPRVPVPDVDIVGTGLQSTWPLITPDDADPRLAVVTFLRHAPQADAVLLFVNRLTDERDIGRSQMQHLGDGLWGLSYRMETDWRASYAFLEHRGGQEPPWRGTGDQRALRALLDSGDADPRNPVSCRNSQGRLFSVVELPDAPPQPYATTPLDSATQPRPQARQVFTGSGQRTVWMHPVGEPQENAPLIILLDGDAWLAHHSLHLSLERAQAAAGLPAFWALFIDAGGTTQRWQDFGHAGGVTQEAAEWIIPWARQTLGSGLTPERTLVIGHSLGGLSALWALAGHPQTVGNVLAQSPSLWKDHDAITGALRGCRGHLRLEVGRQEWVLLEPARRLVSAVGDSALDADLVEFNGGHDFACWRGGLMDGIAAFLQEL